MARWKMYLVQKNSFVDNVCCIFEDSYIFVWITLILHPGLTNLYLETVTIKGADSRRMEPKAEGREKPRPSKLNKTQAVVFDHPLFVFTRTGVQASPLGLKRYDLL